MLISFANGVKKYFRSRYPKEAFLLSGILVVLIITFFGTVVMADEGWPEKAVGYYTQDGEKTWLFPEDNLVVDLRGLSPSEMEKRFPMSAEAEAAIVHAGLPCPVIVDGVRYEGDQVSLFNGKRLRYVIGDDGTLYAFTTAEGLEEYQAGRTAEKAPSYEGEISMFFKDWLYTGDMIALATGNGYSNLIKYDFDQVISSVQTGITADLATLYDGIGFTGNSLDIDGGRDIPQLTTYGWNDRAMSVKTK